MEKRIHDTRLDSMMDARSGTMALRYYWYLGRYDTRHFGGGDMFVMHFRYLLYLVRSEGTFVFKTDDSLSSSLSFLSSLVFSRSKPETVTIN